MIAPDHDPSGVNRGRHDHTPEEERQIRDSALDDTVAASFPASDAPSSIPNPDDHDAAGGKPESDSRRKTDVRAPATQKTQY